MQSVEELMGFWGENGTKLSYVSLAEILRRFSFLVHKEQWTTARPDDSTSASSTTQRRSAPPATAAVPLAASRSVSEVQGDLGKVLSEVCAVVQLRCKWYEPHHGSLVLQHLAMLRHPVDPALLDALLQRMTLRMGEAYSVDLARTAHALVSHQHAGPPAWWDGAAAALAAKLPTGKVPTDSVPEVLVPMIRLGRPLTHPLASAVAADVGRRYKQYSVSDLARTLWALAKAKPDADRSAQAAGDIAFETLEADQTPSNSSSGSSSGSSNVGGDDGRSGSAGRGSKLFRPKQLVAMSQHVLKMACSPPAEGSPPVGGPVLSSFVNAAGQLVASADVARWRDASLELLEFTERLCLPLLPGLPGFKVTELANALARVDYHPEPKFVAALQKVIESAPADKFSQRQRSVLGAALKHFGQPAGSSIAMPVATDAPSTRFART